MARMNWETARRREYVRVHGGDRVAPESRASGTFRRSSWNTTCKVCGGRIAKGQNCYLVRPGVLCKPCAGGLIRRGELPNDARSTKGRAKLGEFRRRLA